MGQTLSSPVLSKKTDSDLNERYAYAISEMQGWRVSMEDSHTTRLKLLDDVKDKDADAFFAVFDGHGGSAVAKFAGDNVHKRLANDEAYEKKDYRQALKRAFLGTDEDLRADPSFFRDPSGCTAVAALLTHDGRIFVANAGDSRSVLCTAGTAEPLSFDHKPGNATEYSRIVAAGGYIEFGRVCGNLSLSRAIGDFEFKKEYSLEPEAQIITSNPDITEHELGDDDEFLVLACDGIWDCLSSQQCMDYIRRSLHQRKSLSEICEDIMDHCVSPDTDGTIGLDNMTVMIVAILNGRTLDEWYDWMVDRVEKNVGYPTPEYFPEIYPAGRLRLASERKRRSRENGAGDDDEDDDIHPRLGAGALGGLARIFAGGGVGEGLSFMPIGGAGIQKATNVLFRDDSSDEDNDDELDSWRSSNDFDGEEADKDHPMAGLAEDHEMALSESSQEEGHSSTKPHVNGIEEPEQLTHVPLGDEPNLSNHIDNHIDGSEDPVKMANAVEA